MVAKKATGFLFFAMFGKFPYGYRKDIEHLLCFILGFYSA